MLPTRLIGLANRSPCGPVKNGPSVAPRIGRSAPSSASDTSACTRSLIESITAAMATSMYWPRPVRARSVRQARMAMAACRPE